MMFDVGFADTPVFRDGLSSTGSYTFLAVKPGVYSGVLYGPVTRTLKFYPNIEYWGLTPAMLAGVDVGPVYDREDYQGVHRVPADQVKAVLEKIRFQRGVVAVTDDMVDALPKLRQEAQSRRMSFHPSTHRVPAEESMPPYGGQRITA